LKLFWRHRRLASAAGILSGAFGILLLTGCASGVKSFPLQEKFGSTATYSRLFDARPEQTCEASRRALLSQGYIINIARADLVEGQKSFQPEAESHLQMVIRVVCAPESADGKISLGFVTALQDSYQLKKSNNSASLGVGALGSVSLPFTSGNDSMVKVGSVTISSDAFYDGFFDLVSRYLATVDDLPLGTQPPGSISQ
jgi:hypothetical protein